MSGKVKIPKYLLFLMMLFIVCYLVSAIVQHRLVSIGPAIFTATAFAYPLSNIILDIVTEVYGYNVSRQMIWCGIVAWFVMGLFLVIIIHLPMPAFWSDYDNKFTFVMVPYIRSILSDSLGILCGQFINIYIISKLKVLLKGRYFWLRSVSSSFIGDIVTILIAIILIYYGTMPLSKVCTIAFYGIVLNIIYCAIAATPAIFVVKMLKYAEKIDIYDHKTDYNPFRFKLND